MLRKLLSVLLLVLSVSGCASEPEVLPEPTPSELPESEYELYRNAISAASLPDSFSAGIRRSYDMRYSNGSISTYDMDGTYEENEGLIHFLQYMNADGLQSEIEGWYEDGRLYMTYNTVTYYEDMEPEQVKQLLLVPLGMHAVSASAVESIEKEETEKGTVFTVTLKPEGARALFDNTYDIYGLSQYEDYTVTSAKVIQTVKGNIPVSEKTDFVCEVGIDDITVSVESISGAEYLPSSTLTLSEEKKEELSAYVNYLDIDTSKITDADITSDLPEDTVTATLKKRLVNRLNYTVQEDGSYLAEFNENETYRFDFTNSVFTYTNRTSRYIYNWKGNIGGFGDACTIDFDTNKVAGDCDDSVVDMMRNVKNFMAMELYYCGVSLDDLVRETK